MLPSRRGGRLIDVDGNVGQATPDGEPDLRLVVDDQERPRGVRRAKRSGHAVNQKGE
jgi:hypothetical protein